MSFIKESKSSCSFFVEKKKHAKGGQSSKTISFFVKKSGQKNNYSRITKSIRKNFFALCGKFINLFDAFNFEIISRNENYAFDYNKNFCRNGNNRKNDLFSRNDYGEKFIFGFGNNLNFGFLFNRKILKTKI